MTDKEAMQQALEALTAVLDDSGDRAPSICEGDYQVRLCLSAIKALEAALSKTVKARNENYT